MPPTDTSKSKTKSSASCHVPHSTDTSKSLGRDNTMTDQNPRNGQHRDRPKPLEADNTVTDHNPQKRTTP